MAVMKCPSCGQPIRVPEKKSGVGWAIGCIVGVVALMVITAVIGLLAAIAIPSFVKARNASQTQACINNLRIIDAAKEQVAMEKRYVVGQAVPRAEASEYIKGGLGALACPQQGEYTLNPVGEDPVCSEHGALGEVMSTR